MRADLSLHEIEKHYRILGLAIGASLEEIRAARNRLIQHFHPDKYPAGWVMDETRPEMRIHLVQTAYCFLTQNYKRIAEQCAYIADNPLTSQAPTVLRSHWIYKSIEQLDKKK